MSDQVEEGAFGELLRDGSTHAFLLRQLQDASAGQIVGGVAHQLRNSLNSILNGVQLLEERGADAELYAKLLPVMSRSAQRIGQMLDALDPSPALHSRGVDLRALLAQCLELLRDHSRQVQIESVEGPPLWVRGSTLEIRNMLLSLLLTHLAGKPGQMRIALQERAAAVELWIENVAAALPLEDSGLAFALQTSLVESLGGSLDRKRGDARSTLTLPSGPHE